MCLFFHPSICLSTGGDPYSIMLSNITQNAMGQTPWGGTHIPYCFATFARMPWGRHLGGTLPGPARGDTLPGGVPCWGVPRQGTPQPGQDREYLAQRGVPCPGGTQVRMGGYPAGGYPGKVPPGQGQDGGTLPRGYPGRVPPAGYPPARS